jgi:hypothetical protein
MATAWRLALVAVLGLALAVSGCAGVAPWSGEATRWAAQAPGETWVRTEMFFGLSRPDGIEISDGAWKEFIDAQVTPRFPDGLTVLSGSGQFRAKDGRIVREGARVLVLLHRPSREAEAAIEQVREAYRNAFQQEGVLRVTSTARVAF